MLFNGDKKNDKILYNGWEGGWMAVDDGNNTNCNNNNN